MDRIILEFINAHEKWVGYLNGPIGIDSVRVITFDTETTIVNGSPDASAGARIVAIGWWDDKDKTYHDSGSPQEFYDYIANVTDPFILVGHNVKFDLMHLLNECCDITDEWNLLGFWDTAIYDYLESGHTHIFPSLEETAKRNNVPFLKDDTITKAFAEGKGADQVDRATLLNYLHSDVVATRDIANEQMTRWGGSLDSHMFVQGWAAVALARMELHGLPIDKPKLDNLKVVLGNKIDRLSHLTETWAGSLLGLNEPIKCTSKVLSTLVWGQPGVKTFERRVVGRYKNGKPRFEKVTVLRRPTTPLLEGTDPVGFYGVQEMHNETLGWKMDEFQINRIAECIARQHGEESLNYKAFSLILELRKREKVMSTYVEPFSKEIEKHPDHHRVFPSYNQTATATGRLSSSGPNGQNLPAEIQELIGGTTYDVISCDFKQLEVWAAAMISRDSQLMKDVAESDVHYEIGKQCGYWTKPEQMNKDTRRTIKGVVFGTIYGGKPKGLSKQSGIDVSTIMQVQAAFYKRYPRFSAWQKERIKTVTAEPSVGPVVFAPDGQALYNVIAKSATGRVFMHRQRVPDWGGAPKPVPSEIVNYPVQSFATADIVPLFLALLHGYSRDVYTRWFCTVHDSVIGITVDYGGSMGKLENIMKHIHGVAETIYECPALNPLTLEVERSNYWGVPGNKYEIKP